MMRALILGGSRYIGRRLVPRLLERGHAVTLYNRGRTPDDFGDRVRRLRGDRRCAADLSAAFAHRSFDVTYDFLCFDANDAGAIATALRGRVGHFVQISTCSVYWCTGDFSCPVREEEFDRFDDFPQRPTSIEYAYGYGKRKAESRLRRAALEGDFAVTLIRLPIVAGESDPGLRHASYCARVMDGRPLVLPDGGLTPFRHVYVGDVARTLADIAGSGAASGEAFNLASREILSVRRLVRDIAGLLRKVPQTVDIPLSLLRRMDASMSATDFSPFTQAAPQIPAIGKAEGRLAWDPTPYETWLEGIVRWWVDSGSKAGDTPPACLHRDRECELAARFQQAVATLCGEAEPDGPPRE